MRWHGKAVYKRMKVFDFDNTLYDGECSLDFFMYCVKKKKSLLRYLPKVAAKAVKYKTSRVEGREVSEFVEEMIKVFFDNCENLDEHVRAFWKLNKRKLKQNMLAEISPRDAVISASPRFLLEGIADMLNTKNLICTELDMENKKLKYLCYSKNKVKSFHEHFGDTRIDEFYTDNMNDMPLMQLADRVFLVAGNKITELKKCE